MSVSDLQKLGLLRPESEWSDHGFERSVFPWRTALLALIALGSCVAMVIGDGSIWTWIGLGCFLLSLTLFVVVNIKAVEYGGESPPAEGD